jgi:hypothetical protein
MELLRGLNPLTSIINCVMENLDEKENKELEKLCEILAKKASFSALHSISPSLHEGVGVVYNRRSGKHNDRLNTPDTWTPMCVLGWFKGGELFLENLGLKIRFQPGDLIVIKGKEEIHEVKEWAGKLRITVVYFTHLSVWKEAGLR